MHADDSRMRKEAETNGSLGLMGQPSLLSRLHIPAKDLDLWPLCAHTCAPAHSCTHT